jgi:sarcosine oxidase subunit beta
VTLRRDAYRAVIVGAGVLGLFTAYHLARAGAGPVLVLERGFLSSGSSGRNGGGVRQQWETRSTVRLARESVAAYRQFGREFGYNIWFRQGGYLFLASSPAELAQLRAVHDLVSSEGLPSRMVGPDDVGRWIEGIAPGSTVGGSYLATDGTLYPFPVLWSLYEAVQSLGVEVALRTELVGTVVRDGTVAGVSTSAGPVTTGCLVNAAGGWSGEISRQAGVPTPNLASRHEIFATEPMKRFLDPMVVRVRDGLYFSQSMRGELIGGIAVPHRPGTARGVPSSPQFLTRMAGALVDLVPRLGTLGVLRAWSGYYDDTPDGFPVIGEDPRLGGFVHANGFGGHGFMLAPAASRRVVAAVLGEPSDLAPEEFAPGRFLVGGRVARAEGLQLG